MRSDPDWDGVNAWNSPNAYSEHLQREIDRPSAARSVVEALVPDLIYSKRLEPMDAHVESKARVERIERRKIERDYEKLRNQQTRPPVERRAIASSFAAFSLTSGLVTCSW